MAPLLFDLHYWPTPNGKKVTIPLEECGAEFLRYNPNRQMQARVDHGPSDGGAPISVIGSGAVRGAGARGPGGF